MIFGWLAKKAEQSQRDEAERFLVSLRGGEIGIINAVHGSAMFWAVFCERQGSDVYNMEQWILSKPFFPTEIGKLIKAQQKQGTNTAATGLMVWLFSARALLYPELRLSGREIWGQLIRSTIDSELQAEETCRAMGYPIDSVDRTKIPLGLQKLDR